MKIETPRGHVYELTKEAIARLWSADNGREANNVFEGFAPHIPTMDRGDVWIACATLDMGIQKTI